MKLTRDNIKVSRDEAGILHININLLNDTVYGVTAAGEGATMAAIASLWEAIIAKEIGIGIHDTMMVVSDFLEKEKAS